MEKYLKIFRLSAELHKVQFWLSLHSLYLRNIMQSLNKLPKATNNHGVCKKNSYTKRHGRGDEIGGSKRGLPRRYSTRVCPILFFLFFSSNCSCCSLPLGLACFSTFSRHDFSTLYYAFLERNLRVELETR